MKIWMGDEEGFNAIAENKVLFNQKVINGSADKLRLSEDDEEDEFMGNPVAYEKQGSVAVLSIEGGTFSRTSGFTRYFGIATYDDIRSRLNKAVLDENIKAIILSIDSPGGQADGVSQLAAEIRAINNKVKPVVSVNVGSMASAAYWYGSSASMVLSDEFAKTGSIGTLLIHREFSKMEKDIGITTTVFRTSPYKAVVNSVEPLNDKAREVINQELDYNHKAFVSGIADNRGLDADYVQKEIATGKMYRANDAIALKMVDKVDSLAAVVAKLNAKFENTGAR